MPPSPEGKLHPDDKTNHYLSALTELGDILINESNVAETNIFLYDILSDDYVLSFSDYNDCPLDLIISVDTVVAHVAGALNKKVWLMLAAVPGWRWDLNYPTTTPWYPSIQLFRQPLYNDWDTVINNIKDELKK